MFSIIAIKINKSDVVLKTGELTLIEYKDQIYGYNTEYNYVYDLTNNNRVDLLDKFFLDHSCEADKSKFCLRYVNKSFNRLQAVQYHYVSDNEKMSDLYKFGQVYFKGEIMPYSNYLSKESYETAYIVPKEIFSESEESYNKLLCEYKSIPRMKVDSKGAFELKEIISLTEEEVQENHLIKNLNEDIQRMIDENKLMESQLSQIEIEMQNLLNLEGSEFKIGSLIMKKTQIIQKKYKNIPLKRPLHSPHKINIRIELNVDFIKIVL